MKKKKQKILFSFCLLIFILSVFGIAFLENSNLTVLAQRKTEIEYPEIPGIPTPITTKTLLPEYIKYIFNFAIWISGLLAFGVLLWGGIKFLTSAGNPSMMSDAKDQIFSGFLGLIILLASYLILTTINPQLVILEEPTLKHEQGLILFYKIEEEEYSIPVNTSISDLDEVIGKDAEATRYKNLSGAKNLEVIIYAEKNFPPEGVNKILREDSGTFPYDGVTPKSIYLRWKRPGIYLCSGDYTEVNGELRCPGGNEVYYDQSSSDLKEFNDKAHSLKIKTSTTTRPGVVLHEDSGFKGSCKEFFNSTNTLSSLEGKVSSLTIFRQTDSSWGEVVLCGNVDCKKYEWASDEVKKTFSKGDYPDLSKYEYEGEHNWNVTGDCVFCTPNGPHPLTWCCPDPSQCFFSPPPGGCKVGGVSALQIKGNYMVILFSKTDFKGKCEVFFESDANLKDNYIGNGNAQSMKIIPIQ